MSNDRVVRRCDSCQWWFGFEEQADGDQVGECHATLPVPAEKGDTATWPYTLGQDWCAHWIPRPDSQDSP